MGAAVLEGNVTCGGGKVGVTGCGGSGGLVG